MFNNNNSQITPNIPLFNKDDRKLKYVAYVRKSTEEAERQAMSISAQIDAIKQQFPDLDITFVTNPDGTVGESMSAAKPGRPLFNQMMSDLESGKYQGVIAWHPDRLSRNSPDASLIVWYIQQGIIQDLKFCNFYFEPTPEGIMMLQMIMSQAQYYSAKLSKDVKRGNAKKRKLGGTTGVAPMGYINNTADHTIEPDPERFDLVRHAFDLMLTGNFSVGEIARIMNEEWGFLLLKRKKSGGKPVSKQGLYNVFRNKLYAGIIIDPYTKEEIPAKHQPMITLEEYDRIQEILCGKGQPRLPHNKEFPYKGFIKCGECGCSITAEHKTKHHKDGTTKEYILYHCTHKNKHHKCKQGSIQEHILKKQIESLLNSYEISPQLYEWGLKAIQEIADRETNNRNDIQSSQNRAIKETQDQLDNLLNLATKGFISADEYKDKSEPLKDVLVKLQKEQNNTNEQTKTWYEIIGTTLETLSSVTDRFNKGGIADKRRVLSALGSNPTLKDGNLSLEEHFWLKPIKENKTQILDEIEKVRTAPQQMKNASNEAIYQLWLGMRDSNPRMVGPEPTALPLGESPTARFIISCLAKASQYSYLTIYIF